MSDDDEPRNVAGPIVQGPDFWGRETDVADLWKLLDRGSVLLSAPRRHGKSSLMTALLREPPPGWTVVHLDVEYVESADEFLTELTASLLRLVPFRRLIGKLKEAPGALMRWLTSGIERIEVGNAGVGELKLALRDGLEDKAKWPELAEDLLGHLDRYEGGLLLSIDEFPMMVGNMLDKNEEAGVHFLSWFRAVRQQRAGSKVRFLLGGSVNIEPRLEALGCQALINDLQRYYLEPLPPARRTSFVAAVLAGEKAGFEMGVPAEIVRVADTGVHFFLQVLMEECRLVARREARQILVADVQRAYEEGVLGPLGRARFSHYQSRLREHYGALEYAARLILGALARARKLSLERLEALVREADPAADFDRVLMLLQSDHYVFVNATDAQFTSGFLRDWWFRNVPAPRARA